MIHELDSRQMAQEAAQRATNIDAGIEATRLFRQVRAKDVQLNGFSGPEELTKDGQHPGLGVIRREAPERRSRSDRPKLIDLMKRGARLRNESGVDRLPNQMTSLPSSRMRTASGVKSVSLAISTNVWRRRLISISVTSIVRAMSVAFFPGATDGRWRATAL
ncbi:MAG TPA: hypothetical protein VIL88_15705 [Devosia sp.]|jgi:hypothetical protein